MKKRSKKGFTLAELLIVVAIIGVLVAIMFPVFGAQLDKARAAAELSNVRAKYAELVAEQMLAGTDLSNPVESGAITIKVDDLQAACTYGETVVSVEIEPNATAGTNGKIKVTYKNKYYGSFETDPDVSFTPATRP